MSEALGRARALDASDPLAGFRQRFAFPQASGGQTPYYFCGNSLGLMPKTATEYVQRELTRWSTLAVEGHFDGEEGWYGYHELLRGPLSRVVGAKEHEVVAMNSLTTNLHLLMVSFYRPTPDRFKILIEDHAFPSDRYAVASQAAFHGYDPDEAIVAVSAGEDDVISTESITSLLEERGDEFALVMMGGVHYYTGQVLDLPAITRAGHKAGARVGFDLAHAAGNLDLRLHETGCDFAAWCSYKYLNSGPGGVSGAFVHDRWAEDESLARFCGWWGNDPETRFLMPDRFAPQKGAAGWQLSNAPVLAMAAHRASLAIFDEATMPALRKKGLMLSGFLYDLLEEQGFEVITPRRDEERGCQISLRVAGEAKKVAAALLEQGVYCDFRHPDVIRLAPVPLYNSFEDVAIFVEKLRAL